MNLIMFKIVIQSLNTVWSLKNRAQLSMLPVYEKCFGFGEFKDESTMQEEIKDDTKIIIHTLFRKEFYSTESLKPIDIKMLEDISWIFTLEENRWNDSQRRVYKLLNPEYEIENLKLPSIYKCRNCFIFTDSPKEDNSICRFELQHSAISREKHCWVLSSD